MLKQKFKNNAINHHYNQAQLLLWQPLGNVKLIILAASTLVILRNFSSDENHITEHISSFSF